MFSDLRTVPTVADVWDKAQVAVRWPSPLTIIAAPFRGMNIELRARGRGVTIASAAGDGGAETIYRLPVDLRSDKRSLSKIEIIVGPAHGAEMLLAGIRTIRAQHPTKADHEFLTQVLAAGRVAEP